MAVQAAFLVQELSDHVGIRDDKGRIGEPLQSIDCAIFLGPFCESDL